MNLLALIAIAIPMVKGLVVIGAASERQGDYEPSTTVKSIDADGSIHLETSAEVPDAAGGKPTQVNVNRTVRSADRKEGRTYQYLFSTGSEETFPGATAIGTSGAVIADLRSRGEASVTLDGQAGGLAGMMSGALGMLPGADGKAAKTNAYLTATGIVKRVEAKPVPYSVLVNNTAVTLPAWHVKGRFGEGDEAADVEWYILDDAENPLTLRFAFGKDKLEIVRIQFPVEDETRRLETELAQKKRAVVYGIYFDFNSAVIKPRSEPVLRTIVAVMKREPSWVLMVEGHTDNIGGDKRNQELSALRAQAVKAALVERGIPADHLDTSGHGASMPRETNKTLAGRARNRRVELTRQ